MQGSAPRGRSRSRSGSSTGARERLRLFAAVAGRSDRDRTAATCSAEPAAQLLHSRQDVGDRHAVAVDAPAAELHFDLAALGEPPADGQPQRAAEQLGVGELLAGTEIAVVVADVDAAVAERAVDRLGEL